MPQKKKLLENAKLYLILDREVNAYPRLFEILQQSVQGGVDMVQLRDKKGSAKDILEFSREARRFLRGRIPYIINDRVDLALIARADGVHLGQDDIPIPLARKMLGSRAMIGISCQTVVQVRKAQQAGADYIGFGSIFKTLTKPQRRPMDARLLKRVLKEGKLPVFAIGGITLQNLSQLQANGVDRAAVCRDICLAKNVRGAAQRLKDILYFRKSRG